MEQALDDLRNPNVFTRRAAASRLVNGPDDARQRPDFEAALADPERRKEVARLLVELLEDDPLAQDGAAAALKRWVVGDVVPDVIAVMEQDARGGTKALVEVLGASKDARAVPLLVKRLRGPLHQPASAAIESIGPAATEPLVKALDDEPNERLSIINLLGKVGTADALPALERITRDSKDLKLSVAARRAQEQINQRR
jgi:HEAT repeat protein